MNQGAVNLGELIPAFGVIQVLGPGHERPTRPQSIGLSIHRQEHAYLNSALWAKSFKESSEQSRTARLACRWKPPGVKEVLSRNDSVGLGSAPAPGAVLRAPRRTLVRALSEPYGAGLLELFLADGASARTREARVLPFSNGIVLA
jgi:hypothetical protein